MSYLQALDRIADRAKLRPTVNVFTDPDGKLIAVFIRDAEGLAVRVLKTGLAAVHPSRQIINSNNCVLDWPADDEGEEGKGEEADPRICVMDWTAFMRLLRALVEGA